MSESLADKAYHQIRQWLLSGKLEPGARLSNRGMADQLNISFTPVREALGRLVSEGLLEYRNGLGVFVPEIDRHGIEDIYELRETIECAAIAKIGHNMSKVALAEMDELLQQMTEIGRLIQDENSPEHKQDLTDQHAQIDFEFHLTLLRAAGNRLALDTVAGLRRMATIVAHSFDVDSWGEWTRTYDEHCRILNALQQGDATEACRIMSEHIRNGCQTTLAAHDRHYMLRPTDSIRGHR